MARLIRNYKYTLNPLLDMRPYEEYTRDQNVGHYPYPKSHMNSYKSDSVKNQSSYDTSSYYRPDYAQSQYSDRYDYSTSQDSQRERYPKTHSNERYDYTSSYPNQREHHKTDHRYNPSNNRFLEDLDSLIKQYKNNISEI
jgi:hypothetical protein